MGVGEYVAAPSELTTLTIACGHRPHVAFRETSQGPKARREREREAKVSRPMICPPAPAPALRGGVRLYSRHHIDLLRVAGALCRR
ncbi:hypothetical protein GCM10009577_02180 [Streptomyces javensis]